MTSEIEKRAISQLTDNATVRLYRETAIRKNGDNPTIAMLDLWHSLCDEKLGVSIEVMISNRRQHQQLGSFGGELNTAFPHIVEGKEHCRIFTEN